MAVFETRRTGVLALEVTRRCHRACRYCYNAWKGPDAYPSAPELPAERLVELVSVALTGGDFAHVQLTGGEPLLRDDLFDLARGIRALGVGVSMVTDGALVDRQTIAQLLEVGVHPVQPTLLAADRAVHDELKGSEGFDATVEAIAAMVAAGVPVSVAFVCTRRNAQHFGDVVELAFALGVRSVAFNRYCWSGVGAHEGAELTPSTEDLRHCLRVARWARRRLAMDVRTSITVPWCAVEPEDLAGLPLGRCSIGSEAPGYTIDPGGLVRACSISATVLGDLKSESWDTLVARAKRQHLARVAALPPGCLTCDVREGCGGGCRESAYISSGRYRAADPIAGRS